MNEDGSSPPPRQSPYSPFPFGSPVGMSGRGGDNKEASTSNGLSFMSVSGAATSPSRLSAFGNNSIYFKGRVRAQEAYGGPVMFGGQAASSRKKRLLAATPYAGSALSSRRPHQRPLFEDTMSSSRRGSSAANTPSPAPSPSPSSTTSDNGVMSSTARLIFDTLEKMSTPVRDAQKLIPSVSCSPPRAEKRRLIAEQLDWSQDSLRRRRPRLGSRQPSGSEQLNGPPLRTIFSPVPASPKPRSTAAKSARLTTSIAPLEDAASTRLHPSTTTASASATQAWGTAAQGKTQSKLDLVTPVITIGGGETSSGLTAKLEKKSPAFSFGGANNSHGGKMRTKLGEPKHNRVSVMTEEDDRFNDPVPAFLSAHNAALPLKDLPVFNFGKPESSEEKKCEKSTPPAPVIGSKPTTMSRTSTESTLPLLPSPVKSVDQNTAAMPMPLASTNFRFSLPSPASSSKGGGHPHDEDDAVPNGIVYSFCQPKEVVSGSSSLNAPSLARTTTIPTSSFDISLHKNHATLPDLTIRSPLAESGSASQLGKLPAKSLKSGSVMDILNRDHSLPDVTASTGVKVSPLLSKDSVMKVLRGGNFK